MINAYFDKFYQKGRKWGNRVNVKYLRIKFKWKKVWKVNLYIYKYWEHIETLEINVLDKIKPIKLDRSWYIKIKEWEKIDFNIIEWGWKYYKGSYDKELVDFKVSKSTWEVSIKAKKITNWQRYQKIYLRIIDKYNQVYDLKVKIKSAKLEVYNNTFNIKSWERKFLNIRNSYFGWIKYISWTNWIISANIVNWKNDTNHYIDIKWIKSWKTKLKITDFGDRSVEVEIIVGDWKEKVVEKDEETSWNGDNLENELVKELKKLFEEFWISGVKINSMEDWVKINSVPNGLRCELWRTGKYWARPYNATCVDNNSTIAWKCKSWFVDMYWVDGTNSCVKTNSVSTVLKYKK